MPSSPPVDARALRRIAAIQLETRDEAAVAAVLRPLLPPGWTIERDPGDEDPAIAQFVLVPPNGAPVEPTEALTLVHTLRKRLPGADVAPMPAAQFDQRPGQSAPATESGLVGLTDDVPPADSKWSLELVECAGAWAIAGQGDGFLIGHPDTGYTNHPELAGRLDVNRGYDFVRDALDPKDPMAGFPANKGHGTGTASVIASNVDAQLPGSKGVTGTAPTATIVPLRVSRTVVLATSGQHERLAKAIDGAVARGCRVISISMGSLWGSKAMARAVRRAADAGCLVIAAAGQPFHKVVFPAAYPEVIAVAACGSDRSRPWWTARGPEVDVTAPGRSVYCAAYKDDDPNAPIVHDSWGTSYATATTAGVAALWYRFNTLNHRLAQFPGRQVLQVFRRALEITAVPFAGAPGGIWGAGLLRASALLQLDITTISLAESAALEGPTEAAAPGDAALEEMCDFFRPSAPRLTEAELHRAVRKLLREILNVGEPELAAALERFGDELAFHFATDEMLFRAAVSSLTAGSALTETAAMPLIIAGASDQLQDARFGASEGGAPPNGPPPPAIGSVSNTGGQRRGNTSSSSNTSVTFTVPLTITVRIGDVITQAESSPVLERARPAPVEPRAVSYWQVLEQTRGPEPEFALEGPLNIGDPVHETMTRHALHEAGVLSLERPANDRVLWEYLRGVFWNDDPEGLLFKSDHARASHFSWGVEWASRFKRAELMAKDREALSRKDLLGRSHFGDLQFLHGMAARRGRPLQETLTEIVRWCEFAWQTARGVIPEDTLLHAVPVAGLPGLFPAHASWPIRLLFGGGDCQRRALGSLLHLLQDSYAAGHVDREDLGDRYRGRILGFHCYVGQDHDKHAADDAWNGGDTDGQRLSRVIGARDAVSVCARTLDHFTRGTEWPAFRDWLLAGPLALKP